MSFDRLPKPLTEKELKLLLSQPNKNTKTGIRNYAIMRFLVDSGARVSEMLALTPSDVEFDTGAVHIWQGKGAVDRTTYVGGHTLDVIRLWMTKRPKGAKTLFCTHQGQPIKDAYIRRMVYNYAEKAGIQERRTYYNREQQKHIEYLKVHPHALRHTYATLRLRRGDNIREVQQLLGHSYVQTTQIYTHIYNDDLARAAKERPTLSF